MEYKYGKYVLLDKEMADEHLACLGGLVLNESGTDGTLLMKLKPVGKIEIVPFMSTLDSVDYNSDVIGENIGHLLLDYASTKSVTLKTRGDSSDQDDPSPVSVKIWYEWERYVDHVKDVNVSGFDRVPLPALEARILTAKP